METRAELSPVDQVRLALEPLVGNDKGNIRPTDAELLCQMYGQAKPLKQIALDSDMSSHTVSKYLSRSYALMPQEVIEELMRIRRTVPLPLKDGEV